MRRYDTPLHPYYPTPLPHSTPRSHTQRTLPHTATPHPLSPPPQELITVRYDVTYTELMDMMSAGKINVVSTYAILLGVKKLREMGFIVEKAGGLQGGVEAEADGLQGRSSG